MTKLALSGLLAEREAMLDVMTSLSEDEWNAPSAEEGMRVRDVVAHVGSTHRGIIDPKHLPGNIDPVATRQNWDIDALVDEFERFTEQTAGVFERMQGLNRSREMGAFGTHPTSSLPDLYLFDMYGHLRGDLLAPYGPIARAEPPRDEARLRPTVDWIIAAQPQMCPVTDAIEITLDGPGGGTWTIGPDAPVVAKVRGSDHDFVLWATKRRNWREFVEIDGDEAAAARALDTIRVI